MSGFFKKIDSSVNKFIAWGRNHKVWRVVIYLFFFCLFWPAIAAYYLARFSKRKLSKASGGIVAAVFIGLGLFFNVGWIAAMSGDSQTNNSQVVSQQKTDQKTSSVISLLF